MPERRRQRLAVAHQERPYALPAMRRVHVQAFDPGRQAPGWSVTGHVLGDEAHYPGGRAVRERYQQARSLADLAGHGGRPCLDRAARVGVAPLPEMPLGRDGYQVRMAGQGRYDYDHGSRFYCTRSGNGKEPPGAHCRRGRYRDRMPDFIGADLRGSRFERVDLSGSEMRAVDLSGARLNGVDLSGAVMRGVELVDVNIHGEIQHVTVNGVDIGPLVNAELDRRSPDRAKMRPADPAGFGEAWDILERLWGETVDRARGFPAEMLHESVDGEWSFIETLRHLVFATDAWIRRAILGDPSPWDPLDLPWDEMPDTPGVPRDRAARPSLEEVLELRRDRMATVREVITGVTDASLDRDTDPVEGPGWPPPRSFPVRQCLLCILNEEWEHRLYVERDLDALKARSA
jgi:hypothetical protein